jgi:hypothetical protein
MGAGGRERGQESRRENRRVEENMRKKTGEKGEEG